MNEIIFALAAFLVAAVAFGLGAIKLFRKKKPMYFQLLVCAAGCFAIEQLSMAVNSWCGITEMVSINMLGFFGCNFFLLSANYGTLDKIVDDGKGSKKAKVLALIAPIIMAVLTAAAFFTWVSVNKTFAVMWVIMFIPALFASYFNLKHILLPIDPFEFLKATKPCNFAALIFYILSAAYAIVSAYGQMYLSGAMLILTSLSMLVLTVFSVKGAKKWGI